MNADPVNTLMRPATGRSCATTGVATAQTSTNAATHHPGLVMTVSGERRPIFCLTLRESSQNGRISTRLRKRLKTRAAHEVLGLVGAAAALVLGDERPLAQRARARDD